MSTILNTLKKLEEEKSVLEKNIDLKELVLQGDLPIYSRARRDSVYKIGFFALMILGAAVLGIVLTLLVTRPSRLVAVEKSQPLPEVASSPVQNVSPPTESFTGVPLAYIPDGADEEPVEQPAFDERRATDDFFSADDSARKEELSPEMEVPPEVEEIDHLIKNVTTAALDDQEEIPVPGVSGAKGPIPGVQVKGIIFFDQNSPFNHIFVATRTSRNRKLRIGETVQEATLQSIEPHKVVFNFQGKPVEVLIGQ